MLLVGLVVFFQGSGPLAVPLCPFAGQGVRAAPAPPPGQGARATGPAKGRCDSSRYDCVGGQPQDFDRQVRVIRRPTGGMDQGCLARLRQAKVNFRLLGGVKGVKTPVEVQSERLGGVAYRKAWNNKRRFILDCRMVEALVVLGRAIRAAGVAGIYYSSTWRYSMVRGQGRLSQHAYGLAIDITAIEGAFGYASVVKDYEQGIWGCGNRNKTPKGSVFRKFYCAIFGKGAFAQVFTPDTDRFHRDHFHVEQASPALRLDSKSLPRRAAPGSRR